jgi:NTE family protein
VVKEVGREAIRTAFQLTQRTTALMIYAINNKKMASCNLLFEPRELEKIGVLDKKSLEKAYRIGYDHASRILEDTVA